LFSDVQLSQLHEIASEIAPIGLRALLSIRFASRQTGSRAFTEGHLSPRSINRDGLTEQGAIVAREN
jgi:hypothetical protein